MSKNYELLQILGKGQRLFAANLQESATATGEASRILQATRTFTSPHGEEQAPSSHDGRRFASPSSESGRCGPLAAFEIGLEREPTSWGERLFRLLGRGKTALSSVIGNRASWRIARSQLNLKVRMELASIAREEQVKLVQRVFLSGKRAPRVVVFCGMERGIGCTRVCAETAVILSAQISGTVCLVDADLRSPTLHRFFGLNNRKGFAEAMLQLEPIQEYTHRLADSRLWIMTSGVRTSDPHALLTSEALRPRMKALTEAFDFVLIDASPLNPFADATKLGPMVDGVVLVIGANSTRREAARKAKEDLKAANSRVLAAVLNRRTFPIPDAIYRRL